MLLSQLGPGSFCPPPVTQPTALCHQTSGPSVVAPTLSLQEGVGGAGQPPTTTFRGPSQCLPCLVGSWEEAELLPSPPTPSPAQPQAGTEQVFCVFSKHSKEHSYQQSAQRAGRGGPWLLLSLRSEIMLRPHLSVT